MPGSLRKAGFPGIRMHDARHTHATLMLEQGVNWKIISERLGHGSVAIQTFMPMLVLAYSKLRRMDSTRYLGLLAIGLKSKRCPECENGPPHLVR